MHQPANKTEDATRRRKAQAEEVIKEVAGPWRLTISQAARTRKAKAKAGTTKGKCKEIVMQKVINADEIARTRQRIWCR